MRRTTMKLAGVGFLVSLALACGGTPDTKPVTEAKPTPKVEKVQGIPPEAVAAFNAGVEALQATPSRYTDAAAAFEKATQLHPDYTVAWLNLAYSYEHLGRHADAAGAYRKLIQKNVTDRGVTLALGRALLFSGEVAQAITEFESVLRDKPDDLEARNNLAAAYLAKRDMETSLRYVKEVLAVQPKNVPAIINLGLLYLDQKKLQLALLMFQKALSYEKDNPKAYNDLGLTWYRMEIVPAAVVSFEKAIALDPTMDEARLNLASVYLDYLDYERAKEQFHAVRERFPKHYHATVGEANAAYGVGQYEEAAKLYAESLELKPDNAEVLLRIGKIYEEQLSQPKKALEFYVRYRDVARPPADDKIHQTIQFLEQADQMQMKQTGGGAEGGAPEGEGTPAAGEAPKEGEAAPAGEKKEGEAAPAGEKKEGEAAPAEEKKEGEAAPAEEKKEGEAAPGEAKKDAAPEAEKKPPAEG